MTSSAVALGIAMDVRIALKASYQGRSGRNVYVLSINTWFRINAVKYRHGVALGRVLSTGNWVQFSEWEER